jgi:hypothetical protein
MKTSARILVERLREGGEVMSSISGMLDELAVSYEELLGLDETSFGKENTIKEIKPIKATKSHHRKHRIGYYGPIVHTPEVEEARTLIKHAFAGGLTSQKIARMIGVGNSFVYTVVTNKYDPTRGMKQTLIDKIFETFKK